MAGASRGGELALLLGSTYPDLRAVVSWVGSGLVYGGVVSMGAAPAAGWTRGGADIPFAGFDVSAVRMDAPPVALTPGFLAALADTARVAAAEIPVERINGPVLLIRGPTTTCGRPPRYRRSRYGGCARTGIRLPWTTWSTRAPGT